MWIPYFLLEFWEHETPLETVTASKSDEEERHFEVWFLLENPPTREREVELKLSNPIYKTQTDGAGRAASMQFLPNSNGQLEAVAFKVPDHSAKLSFRYCYDRLCQLLSFWALVTGSGFSVFGLRIVDVKHNTRWKVLPQRAAADPFVLPQGIDLPEEHAAIVSLYREGRNAQSPFYRFLCCYKILEAWYKSGGIFAQADRLIREKGLPLSRPRRRITHDTLVLSLVFNAHPEFENVTFVQFFDLLNPWRLKVAHAVTDEGTFVNFDRYEAQTDLGPIANLTDMVARQILLDEFDLWGQINEAITP